MYIFIVNPVAGNGRGSKVFHKLAKSNLFQKMELEYFFTEYTGHAEEIAAGLAGQNLVNLQAIIVIGGDGTIHEVLNGLGNAKIPVGFIPGGSGNDFGRGCGIKGSPETILQKIVANSSSLPYWTGDFITEDSKRRKFVNSIGFGFDAEIAIRANKSFLKKFFSRIHLGTLGYVMALITVLFQFKPFDLVIEVNGKKQFIPKCWMVTIANHQFYGGGMKIIPSAMIQPEVLPVLIIQGISKLKVLGVFLTVFFGKHISFKEVSVIEAKHVTIYSENPIYYQVDGQTGRCNSCQLMKSEQKTEVLGSNVTGKVEQQYAKFF